MKPIGYYSICNTSGVCVYDIEDERILAGFNTNNPEWCRLIEIDDEYGFFFGKIFIPLDEVMKV